MGKKLKLNVTSGQGKMQGQQEQQFFRSTRETGEIGKAVGGDCDGFHTLTVAKLTKVCR